MTGVSGDWPFPGSERKAMVVGEMLRMKAGNSPVHTAIVFKGESLSYKILNESVNGLGNELLRSNLKNTDRWT